MPRRLRVRQRLLWPQYGYCPWPHPYWGPPPWWGTERPTKEEEKEDLKEHIEMLKDELKFAEEQLKEMEESK
ncbi:MAG: DUF5320 family protein [Deltaproteobacteria bacterium]|nr:DUF5320 family protein [Deltaproteobacteria bacterium]